MAYADIQNKVGQIQMANRVLLAQSKIPPPNEGEGTRDYRKRISDGTYKNNRQFPQSKVNKPKPKPTDKIPPDMEEFYGGPSKEVIEERKKAIDKIRRGRRGNPTDEEIQEALREDDYKRGDYLQDPEQPFNINTLLQIGGAIGGGIVPLLQQLLIRNPNAMAMNFEDAGFGDGGFISTDKPHIYINRGAEAYILMPDGDFRFDGFYDPKRHGNAFPGLGLVQRNDGMKIAKTPYTPPTEKMVVGNKLEDSPLRFKTDDQREQYMLDYSKNFRYDGT